ncbi:ATP-binding protein [Undibacterium seohonense]|uniref:ATP-binding protein n=1 Tax=Undibacterium seohonense TaxID=1344950 RepID=A0ABR6XAV5_9BURK|nr:ATP-binding protein [Undibacterium seohonense]MBC3809680.1 ATP-binding protein [Undibacterium seohonense]
MQDFRSTKSSIIDVMWRIGVSLYALMITTFNLALIVHYWRASPLDSPFTYYSFVCLLMLIAIAKAYLFFLFYSGIRFDMFCASVALLLAEAILTVIGPASTVGIGEIIVFLGANSLLWVICWKWMAYIAALSEPITKAQEPMLSTGLPTPNAISERALTHQKQNSSELPVIRYVAKPSRTTFDQIWGMHELKSHLARAMNQITDDDANQNLETTRNGILFFGEPGNGKTFFADAIAGELDLPIISVSYGDIASKWINDTTENLMRVFADAREQAPCVLFFDEIDSLISDRTLASSTDETARSTNVFLTEIVNLRQHAVLFIGATNFFDQLDTAAIREGRFDFKIEINPPDEEARGELLYRAIDRYFHVTPQEEKFFRTYAKRWQGFSVKRIQSIGQELYAIREEEEFDRIDSHLLNRAMRSLQGRKGHLPENTLSLADLILSDELCAQLTTIATRMKNVDHIESMGGTIPSGLLFYGEPGTGKTETARALAKESQFAFLNTSGNDLIHKTGEIERLLKEARDIRPCIIFIDEADDVLASRGNSYVASITNKLLTAMDGAGGRVRDLVFIAATNHPDQLDPAALRGGRFTEKVHFVLPTKEHLCEFVLRWMTNSRACFCEDMSFAEIVDMFGEGASIATANAIMQEAVNQMIGRSAIDGFNLVFDSDIKSAVRVVRNLS